MEHLVHNISKVAKAPHVNGLGCDWVHYTGDPDEDPIITCFDDPQGRPDPSSCVWEVCPSLLLRRLNSTQSLKYMSTCSNLVSGALSHNSQVIYTCIHQTLLLSFMDVVYFMVRLICVVPLQPVTRHAGIQMHAAAEMQRFWVVCMACSDGTQGQQMGLHNWKRLSV
jgi:hypothetical protein